MSRPLSQIINEIRNKKLDLAGGDLINELVAACHETRKVGKFTLELTFRPDSDPESNVINIEPKMTLKTPRKDLSGSAFFMDEEGNLTRNDPRQHELALAQVADTGRARPGVTGSVLRDTAMGREVALPA